MGTKGVTKKKNCTLTYFIQQERAENRTNCRKEKNVASVQSSRYFHCQLFLILIYFFLKIYGTSTQKLCCNIRLFITLLTEGKVIYIYNSPVVK
jgi:hypothetical protein